MHEFSVMSQMVDGIIEEATKAKAVKVEEVILELGEFTMLGEEQLRFAYEILTKDTLLKGSTLTIKPVRGSVECACGFRGEASPKEDSPHRSIPVTECPSCGQLARIVGGRECTVKNLRVVVPDV